MTITAGTQTIALEVPKSISALGDDEVADEIRIVASVQTQGSMPILLFGNAISVAFLLYLDWAAAVSSQAVYFLAVELLLLLPMLRSYLRLRRLPLPTRVSTRRVRRIEVYSFVLGLVWAIAIILMMRQVSPIDGVAIIVVMFILGFGGPALAPSLPRASVAYSGPIVIASFVGAYINDILTADVLILLYTGATVSIGRTIWQSRRDTTARVRMNLENLRVETEQKQLLEAVSNQLAKYMSPQLFQSIFSGEQKVEIESKRKKLTIFFSDIANFTEITDQLESEQLTSLLNQYLTEMSKIAQEHGAYFDKFIGDAMVFYFGDPETMGVKEDASACVRMAIAMQRRLGELQVGWREQGLIDRPFETRIGINTGYCTVGNFGSEDRMDYTIIGGEVNLAARLEAEADAGGILLANETYSLVKDWLLAEEREAITVKGFARPVRTFSVKGIYDELAAEGRVIHREKDGLTLTIDRDRMSKADAVKELKDALAQLEE